jgi:predicted DNA-binding protein YlxM (UPF0122 family)/ribosomal protein S27AE
VDNTEKLNHLALCAGYDGIGLGLELAGVPIGFTVYVEIEAFAVWNLVQKIESGKLAPGVIWPDLKTFPDPEALDAFMVDMDASLCYDEYRSDKEVCMSQKRDSKYDCVKEMYEKGLSIEDVANYFAISRQAMHKIMRRRGVTFREQLRFKEQNHFYRGGVKMDKRAQHLVEAAVTKGLLIPKPCENCGSCGEMKDGRSTVQAHHDNYAKPLEVRWLCQKCHHLHHRKEYEEANRFKIDILSAGFP